MGDRDLTQMSELAIPSRPRLNVLILHDNHDLSQVRRTSFNHSFCLLKYAPWNNYDLQSVRDPVPAFLRRRRFDVVVLDTTFLCWRWTYPREDNFERLLREYAFIAESDAVKVALPQDEYDHSALLDQWLTDWRVDLIYSVCYEYRELLYPKASARADIVEGMTGYIDDADFAMMSRGARPFAQREIDVGYRAKSLPPYFRTLRAAQGGNWRAVLRRLCRNGAAARHLGRFERHLSRRRMAAIPRELSFHARLPKRQLAARSGRRDRSRLQRPIWRSIRGPILRKSRPPAFPARICAGSIPRSRRAFSRQRWPGRARSWSPDRTWDPHAR